MLISGAFLLWRGLCFRPFAAVVVAVNVDHQKALVRSATPSSRRPSMR